MVQPNPQKRRESSTRRRESSSSSDPWMVFLVKVLFVALIILLLPKLVETKPPAAKRKGSARNRRNDRQIVALRFSCYQQQDACSSMVLEEAQNCIHQCMSQRCYQDVYANDPLEDGEINMGRMKEFELCVKEELKQARMEERAQERLAKRAASGTV